FCNKLWNAARYVLMNCADANLEGEASESLADRWIRSRTRTMLADAERAIDTYRFDLYANTVYEFVWHEYCDWYLELTKPLLWDESATAEDLRGTRRTLLTTLDCLLRAAHPIMPFITETIWREVAPLLGSHGATIMLQPFPETAEYAQDEEADAAIEWLKGAIEGLRNIRGEAGIKPSQAITVLLQGGDESDRRLAKINGTLLQRLAKVTSVDWLEADETAPPNALALVGELKVMVPLAGLIDVAAETARLGKEVERLEKELGRLEGKLRNENFVAKAPAEVVDKERQKAEEARAALAVLREQMDGLADLA
ncbi:MAG: valine--tRNA ligase, partial [Gammaproteobacteria bacterium]